MLRNSLWITIGLAAMIVAVMGCGAPPPVEPESFKVNRPSYDGYYLAAPATPLPEFSRLATSSLYQIMSVNLELEIGKDGRVRRINPRSSILPTEWDSFSTEIKQMLFYPGRSGDRLVSQILPVRLVLGRERYQQKIITPVDSMGVVLDPDLYWAGMRLNNIDLPSLNMFPSYFLDIDLKDTSTDLNYLLARLDLDSSGRVKAYETIHSDAGQYTDQILEAANWADYNVSLADDSLIRSVYLRVALYNTVQYPTLVQKFPVDTLHLPERERIKLLPDTIGLMFKPIPMRYQSDGIYSILGGRLTSEDTVNIEISIGTEGQVTQFNPIGASLSQKLDYRELAIWMRFFPALDFNGTAHTFSGIMRLEYHAGTMVRMRFLWLDGEGER